MVTVNAFNELVRQFVSELKDIFPEEPKIKKMYNGLDMVFECQCSLYFGCVYGQYRTVYSIYYG